MMDGKGKLPDIAGGDLAYRIQFSEADVLKPKSESPFLGITYIAAQSGVKAAQGREAEAEAIARLLKNAKRTGTIQSWKEVAMLLRAMTNVEIYLSALEAHQIPVYVFQGAAFYQKTEVSDLIAFLELVLHPDDELLRTTILTSSLVGLNFGELLRPDDGIGGRKRLDQLVGPFVQRRDTLTAAEILQDVIRATDYDVVMMAQRNGRQRVANIGKLIEITRDLARQGTTALDDVVRYLRDRAQDTTVREQEAQVLGQGDDVVHIMTVHQAKGLEFDIVVLPDLAAKPGRSAGERTFFSERWGILAGAAYGLHRKPLPHALILEAKDLEDDQQYEEEKRLLYVALTRARKMLVLGEGFAKQGTAWLRWVESVFEAAQPGAIATAREGTPVTVRFKGCLVKVVPASRLNVPEQLTLNSDTILIGEPHIPLVRIPRSVHALDVTPSDLSSLHGCFRYFHQTRVLGNAEPGKESSGETPNMRVGTLAHKFLETQVTPSAEWLTGSELRDLYSVFESQDWKALSEASPEREMPFMMHIDVDGKDCWIRGRMDAVVPGDVPRVIDYKYAAWRDGAEADYEIQMTAYALALMKSLGARCSIGELWYLKAPMKIIRSEYDFNQAEERLRDLISRYIIAIESGQWPMAARDYCDRVECGFRSHCWQ
jgi:ATP-dependent helicase/nuclease subunit A